MLLSKLHIYRNKRRHAHASVSPLREKGWNIHWPRTEWILGGKRDRQMDKYQTNYMASVTYHNILLQSKYLNILTRNPTVIWKVATSLECFLHRRWCIISKCYTKLPTPKWPLTTTDLDLHLKYCYLAHPIHHPKRHLYRVSRFSIVHTQVQTASHQKQASTVMAATARITKPSTDHSITFAGWHPCVSHLIHGSSGPCKSASPKQQLNQFGQFWRAHHRD